MDSKNTIAAIALSSAVLVLYSLFFVPEKSSTSQNPVEKEKIEQSTDTPSLEKKETLIEISRKDALIESERVKFENSNVIIDGNTALAMGNYFFTSPEGAEVKVEYTFGYIEDGNGDLRIQLHHSSMPAESE